MKFQTSLSGSGNSRYKLLPTLLVMRKEHLQILSSNRLRKSLIELPSRLSSMVQNYWTVQGELLNFRLEFIMTRCWIDCAMTLLSRMPRLDLWDCLKNLLRLKLVLKHHLRNWMMLWCKLTVFVRNWGQYKIDLHQYLIQLLLLMRICRRQIRELGT